MSDVFHSAGALTHETVDAQARQVELLAAVAAAAGWEWSDRIGEHSVSAVRIVPDSWWATVVGNPGGWWWMAYDVRGVAVGRNNDPDGQALHSAAEAIAAADAAFDGVGPAPGAAP